METKDQLITVIREWVKLDNEIRTLKNEEKIRKTSKDKLSAILMDTMKQNSLDEIAINNGQLKYSKKTVKKPITKTTLLQLLSKYYDGNTDKANEVREFIMENREETVQESIVRKIDKL
jgi:hypothetical protein